MEIKVVFLKTPTQLKNFTQNDQENERENID